MHKFAQLPGPYHQEYSTHNFKPSSVQEACFPRQLYWGAVSNMGPAPQLPAALEMQTLARQERALQQRRSLGNSVKGEGNTTNNESSPSSTTQLQQTLLLAQPPGCSSTPQVFSKGFDFRPLYGFRTMARMALCVLNPRSSRGQNLVWVGIQISLVATP